MYSPKLSLLFLALYLLIGNTSLADEKLPSLKNLSLDDLKTTEEVIIPDTETNTETFLSLVPNLIGTNVDGAAGLLGEYHLTLGKVTMVQNNAPADQIISQSITPESNIKQWSTIDVTVSTGSEVSAPEESDQKKETTSNNEPTSSVNEKTQTEENKVIEIPAPEIIESSTPQQSTNNDDSNNATLESPSPQQKEEKPEPKTELVETNNEITSASKNTDSRDNELKTPVATPTEATDPDTPEKAAIGQAPVEQKPEASNDKEAEADQEETEKTPEKKTDIGNVSIQISPKKELQAKREITFTVIPPEEINDKDLDYILNISGKTYRQSSPEFTHKFEEPDWVIITGSARIPGKPWHHSNSKRVEIKKYVAKKIKVPNVVGKNEQGATAILEKQGLAVGNVQMKNMGEKTGIVEQRPKAGTVLTEDNNKVYLVKAAGQKYRVNFSADNTEAEARTPIKFTTQLTPPPTKSISYRFVVDGEKQIVQEKEWTYEFTTAGQHTVSVEAIVAGEGAFTSQEILINIAEPWQKPLAIISPSSITLDQGEKITFENLSSGQAEKTLETIWTDHQGQTLTSKDLTIDTRELTVGNYQITLKVKDERGFESEANASFSIQQKEQADAGSADTLTALANEAAETETETETDIIEVDSPKNEEQKNTKESTQTQNNTTLEEALKTEKATETDEPASTQKSLAESKNMTFWLWMGVLIVLFYAIFWFVRKLK
jgi:beta-lactam-binding protein with PASTA domain